MILDQFKMGEHQRKCGALSHDRNDHDWWSSSPSRVLKNSFFRYLPTWFCTISQKQVQLDVSKIMTPPMRYQQLRPSIRNIIWINYFQIVRRQCCLRQLLCVNEIQIWESNLLLTVCTYWYMYVCTLRSPCCVLLALSWNTNENPSTDKLSTAIN